MLVFQLFGFLDSKTLFLIVHLLGVALGAGGAFVTDAMYFMIVKDRVVTKSEICFLHLGSRIVWLGIIILVVSGLLIFALNTGKYLDSTKFIAKMAIVIVLIINGLIFHFWHLPFIESALGRKLSSANKQFKSRSVWLYVSGAVSVISWLATIVLGGLRSVPMSALHIMGIYGAVLAVAISIALLMRHRYLRLSR